MVDTVKDFQQKENIQQKEDFAVDPTLKNIENVAYEVDKDGMIQKEYLDQQASFHAHEVQVLENEVLPGIFEKFKQRLEQKFGFTFTGVNDNRVVIDASQGFSKQSPQEQVLQGLSKDTRDINENINITVHNETNLESDKTTARTDAMTGNTFLADVTVSNAGKNVNNYTVSNVANVSYYTGTQKPVVAGTNPDKSIHVFSLQAKESLTKTYNNFDFYTNLDVRYILANQKEELYKTGQGTFVTKDKTSYLHTGVNAGVMYTGSTKNVSSKFDASAGVYPRWYTTNGAKTQKLGYELNFATYTTIGGKRAGVNPYIETATRISTANPTISEVMTKGKVGLYIFKKGSYNYDIHVFGDYDKYSKTLFEEFKDFARYTYGVGVTKNLSFIDRNYDQEHNIEGVVQGGVTKDTQNPKPSPFFSFGIKYYFPKK